MDYEYNYVIETIIENSEKSQVDWREGKAGKRSFSLENYQKRDYLKVSRSEFARQIRQLEVDGLLVCKWYDRYSELSEAKYCLKDLPEFYKRAGKRDKYIRQNLLTAYIEEQMEDISKKWIYSFFSECKGTLEQGKVPKELKKANEYLICGEHPEDQWRTVAEEKGYLDIFCVFHALDRLEEPVYKRIFSSSILKDRIVDGKTVRASKVFQKCHQSVVVAKARAYCENVEESMSDTEVLSEIFIEEYSQQLSTKGPLLVGLNGNVLDLSLFTCGHVMNSQTLKNGNPLSGQTIRTIITVENQANYESMVYCPDTLLIFCHGYFTPRERAFLILIRKCLEGKAVEYYHMGDMDFGSICIFRYLRTQIFPQIRPLNMDVDLYDRFLNKAEKLEDSALEKLKHMKEPLLQPLIDRMVETGLGIEQENFVGI